MTICIRLAWTIGIVSLSSTRFYCNSVLSVFIKLWMNEWMMNEDILTVPRTKKRNDYFHSPDEDFRWKSKRWGTNNFLVVIDELITVKFFQPNKSIRTDFYNYI